MPPRPPPPAHFLRLWTTNQHAYAVVHRAADGGVVAAASTNEKGLREGGVSPKPDKETCTRLGALLAERAAAAGVPGAAWRRARGQRYHGRAAALLTAAKEGGFRLL